MVNHMLIIDTEQLEDLKQIVTSRCSLVCHYYRDQKMPSAFKRNDAFARALGYKGHSDLVNRARGRIISDTENALSLSHEVKIRVLLISEQLTTVFSNLTAQQICDVLLFKAPIDRTPKNVVEGISIHHFSPIKSNIPNEDRSPLEIEKWWNVPYIVEDWDGENSRFFVECLDGGAWDRPTGKAWCQTVDEALDAAKSLKLANLNYRDYGEPPIDELRIVLDCKFLDENVHDADALANKIIIKLLSEQTKGWDFAIEPQVFLSLPVSSGISLSTVRAVAKKLYTFKVTKFDDDSKLECFSKAQFVTGNENKSIDMLLEVNRVAVPYLYTLTMIREL